MFNFDLWHHNIVFILRKQNRLNQAPDDPDDQPMTAKQREIMKVGIPEHWCQYWRRGSIIKGKCLPYLKLHSWNKTKTKNNFPFKGKVIWELFGITTCTTDLSPENHSTQPMIWGECWKTNTFKLPYVEDLLELIYFSSCRLGFATFNAIVQDLDMRIRLMNHVSAIFNIDFSISVTCPFKMLPFVPNPNIWLQR